MKEIHAKEYIFLLTRTNQIKTNKIQRKCMKDQWKNKSAKIY